MNVYPVLPREASGAVGLNLDSRDGAAFTRPADFDPAEFPILARHFGIKPLGTIDPIAAEVVADMRFRRGPRTAAALGLAGPRGS